jgi:hypothetical protein
MPRWSEVEAEVPELARHARRFFDAGTHKTIATLRRDGSPRISGTECLFAQGDLWFGSMWLAMKALDIRRDPRFSLHSSSADPSTWDGDAKVAGTVEEITDPERIAAVLTQAPPGPAHLFRADITELVVVSLNEQRTKLVIEAWHPDRGVTRSER